MGISGLTQHIAEKLDQFRAPPPPASGEVDYVLDLSAVSHGLYRACKPNDRYRPVPKEATRAELLELLPHPLPQLLNQLLNQPAPEYSPAAPLHLRFHICPEGVSPPCKLAMQFERLSDPSQPVPPFYDVYAASLISAVLPLLDPLLPPGLSASATRHPPPARRRGRGARRAHLQRAALRRARARLPRRHHE